MKTENYDKTTLVVDMSTARGLHDVDFIPLEVEGSLKREKEILHKMAGKRAEWKRIAEERGIPYEEVQDRDSEYAKLSDELEKVEREVERIMRENGFSGDIAISDIIKYAKNKGYINISLVNIKVGFFEMT